MRREGDDDDASHTIVVLVAATSDCGVNGQADDMVTSGPGSSDGQELPTTGKSEPHEEQGTVLAVVCVMFGTPYKASFFAAVGLSGMGAGVIDTFLFIRYGSVCVSVHHWGENIIHFPCLYVVM